MSISPRLHPRDELGRLGGGPDRVRGDDRGARLGEELADLVGDPLDAGAAGDEAVLLLALGAGVGRGHDMAAMVAGEPAGEAVLDHPGGAIRALEAVAAMAAEGERRIAAAVEEQQALLARLEILRQRLDQGRRQPAAARRRVLKHVDRRHVGQARAAIAVGQLQLPVGADLGLVAALDRRRGRGEDDRHLLQLGAHHRDVAGVILHAFLLLEARLVRLVDDDQAELRIGQEQRRAGADRDPRLAAGDRPPGAAALRLPEARMPGDRLAAEAGGEALQERLGERDLGEQDERLAALAERLGDRLEIDLGLARAGDAVEQPGREFARIDRGAKLGGRFGLGGLQRGRLMLGIGLGKGIVDRHLDRLDRAGLDQARGSRRRRRRR